MFESFAKLLSGVLDLNIFFNKKKTNCIDNSRNLKKTDQFLVSAYKYVFHIDISIQRHKRSHIILER